MTRHGVHVVGDYGETPLGGMFKDLRVRGTVQGEVACAGEFNQRLAAEDAGDDMFVQIVVGEEARAAHDLVPDSAPLSARSRCTTGLGCCSHRACHSAQTAS